jgi:truncated hemoglobin YjbI
MRHMIDALERVIADGAPIDEAHAAAMRDYFRRAADMLVNSPG